MTRGNIIYTVHHKNTTNNNNNDDDYNYNNYSIHYTDMTSHESCFARGRAQLWVKFLLCFRAK